MRQFHESDRHTQFSGHDHGGFSPKSKMIGDDNVHYTAMHIAGLPCMHGECLVPAKVEYGWLFCGKEHAEEYSRMQEEAYEDYEPDTEEEIEADLKFHLRGRGEGVY